MTLKDVAWDSVIETGEISLAEGNTGVWKEVKITGTFNNPIVILGPLSYNGATPVTVRIHDVFRTSFRWSLQRWDNKQAFHTAETVSYMVVERGHHTLADGTVVEAQKTSAGGEFAKVSFSAKFENAPILLSQVSTQWKAKAYNTRVKYITDDSFSLKIQSAENSTADETEEVSWVAITKSTKKDTKWFATTTKSSATDKGLVVKIDNTNSGKYQIFAEMQTNVESDPAEVRFRNRQQGQVELILQEETSKDAETKHASESLGVVALWGTGVLVKKSELKADAPIVKPPSTGKPYFQAFPLKDPVIYVKTRRFKKNAIDYFSRL